MKGDRVILVIETEDYIPGDWSAIEGDSAAELGSLVQIRSLRRNATVSAQGNGRVVGYGTVLGFKASNKANQPMARFAKNIQARR